MLWNDLIGHQQQIEWFRTAVASGRLASSFLFIGPEGIGKRTFARLLAKSLLCSQGTAQDLVACGHCEDCVQVDASTHPDLIQVAKPADKAFIPIELLIGEREKRMREGLCHDISLRPYSGSRKVAILDDADALNAEGANSLLKTLEEPPSDSLLILIGTSLQRQLPTIRSRCQTIVFRPLSPTQIEELLLRTEVVESPEAARELATTCGGSLAEANLLAEPELREFRGRLFQLLADSKLPLAELAKNCGGVVDAAGKEAKAKRERLKLLLRMSASFYRGLALRHSSSAARHDPPAADQELENAVSRACGHWKTSAQGALECWQRCLTAIEQVDRNANQTTLLETWASDLARMSRC